MIYSYGIDDETLLSRAGVEKLVLCTRGAKNSSTSARLLKRREIAPRHDFSSTRGLRHLNLSRSAAPTSIHTTRDARDRRVYVDVYFRGKTRARDYLSFSRTAEEAIYVAASTYPFGGKKNAR